jgi:hypothetical protein
MTLQDILKKEEEIENPNFKKKSKVHDWKNYVGDFEYFWDELTFREKQIIYVLAEQQASAEYWD